MNERILFNKIIFNIYNIIWIILIEVNYKFKILLYFNFYCGSKKYIYIMIYTD